MFERRYMNRLCYGNDTPRLPSIRVKLSQQKDQSKFLNAFLKIKPQWASIYLFVDNNENLLPAPSLYCGPVSWPPWLSSSIESSSCAWLNIQSTALSKLLSYNTLTLTIRQWNNDNIKWPAMGPRDRKLVGSFDHLNLYITFPKSECLPLIPKPWRPGDGWNP